MVSPPYKVKFTSASCDHESWLSFERLRRYGHTQKANDLEPLTADRFLPLPSYRCSQPPPESTSPRPHYSGLFAPDPNAFTPSHYAAFVTSRPLACHALVIFKWRTDQFKFDPSLDACCASPVLPRPSYQTNAFCCVYFFLPTEVHCGYNKPRLPSPASFPPLLWGLLGIVFCPRLCSGCLLRIVVGRGHPTQVFAMLKQRPSSRAPTSASRPTETSTSSHTYSDDSSQETGSQDYSSDELYDDEDDYDDDDDGLGPSDSASTSDHDQHYRHHVPAQRQHQLPPHHQYPPQHQFPPHQQQQLAHHQPPSRQPPPHQSHQLQTRQPGPPQDLYSPEEEPRQPHRRQRRDRQAPPTANLEDPYGYGAPLGRGGYGHPQAAARPPRPGSMYGRGQQPGYQNQMAPYMGGGYPANGQMVPFGGYGDPTSPYGAPGYGGEGRGMYDMMPYQQQPPPQNGFYGAVQPHPYSLQAQMAGMQLQHRSPPPPPAPTEPPAKPATPAPPKEDPEKIRLEAEIAAFKAMEEKVKAAEKQKEAEAQIRKEAEEAFHRRMEDMRLAQEEAKKEIEKARLEAEKAARERMEAERKAEEKRAQEHARAMAEAEEKARLRFEAEMKAAEDRRKAEAEARIQAEEDARKKFEAAAKAAEEQRKAEAEARAQAEKDAREKYEAEMKAAAEQRKAEAEAKAKAEEEARLKYEAELKAAEERGKREAEERVRAEREARLRFEAELRAAEERRIKEEEERKQAEELARVRFEKALQEEAAAKAAAAQKAQEEAERLMRAEQQAKEDAAKKAAEEAEKLKKLEEDARAKAEADTLKRIEDEKKKAEEAAAAEAAAKKAAEELKAKIEEETKAKLEESNKTAEKAPIRFKDAVGRKFSFPFHLCATWQGMEDLIKQAFMQVDVLGPHVMEGHYDLIAPDGEIILPSVWEKVVQPDWSITMTMWPMDKLPQLGPKMPGPHPKHPHAIPIPPGRPMGMGVPPGMRPPNMPPHGRMPGGGVPPAPGWSHGDMHPGPVPDVVTVSPAPGKPSKSKKPSKDHGSGMAGFLFGKPQKKRSSRK
ncbi:unnamed protein product [Fusarium venenatum]|uniref:Ubiquitin-like domain-containing protein n=1 Tax=Fusarium venenatum TaxID=56646 RepID=A0A2L2SV65_9HYPO|nr:uncharacterized protein FVRRES_12256 [Fusarium venenatum]CEI39565.1 unnamed protein product [Fusarium venenatum]